MNWTAVQFIATLSCSCRVSLIQVQNGLPSGHQHAAQHTQALCSRPKAARSHSIGHLPVLAKVS